MRILPLLAAATLLPAAAPAAECSTRSGAHTAALVELYTSEGCNSCPPADRWFSTLAAPVVPLAFHVDYWDSLGWKDRFASPAFTRRQYEGARLSGSASVYTPQVRLSGRDFRRWGSPAAFGDAVEAMAARPARADLAIAVRPASASLAVSVEASAMRAPGNLDLYLAVTEDRLVTQVKAGENRGETLRHDKVVRDLRALGALDASGRRSASLTLALPADWKREDLGLAAFVQDRRTGEVVQAVALPLCGG